MTEHPTTEQHTAEPEVLDRLTDILHRRFDVPLNLLIPSTVFAALELDSLAVEEFNMMVAEDFGHELWDNYNPETTLAQAAEAVARGLRL
ncbi:hypothetical protein [Streptomyces sp. Ac-502]|uniref:hypothetical protein n=1 Tax=Streptomyces sp. Ac-502 TaxID=3342801 RepID=UPI0038625B26